MMVLKVVGCGLGALVALRCLFWLFLFVREWYAKWRGERALSKCQRTRDALQENLSKIQEEIDERVSQQPRAMSPEDEWQGYRDKLRGVRTPGAHQDTKAIDTECDLFGLIWYLRNARARKWEICPELCQQENDLQARLEHENKAIHCLKKMHQPYFMSRHNYCSWRAYCQERKNAA